MVQVGSWYIARCFPVLHSRRDTYRAHAKAGVREKACAIDIPHTKRTKWCGCALLLRYVRSKFSQSSLCSKQNTYLAYSHHLSRAKAVLIVGDEGHHRNQGDVNSNIPPGPLNQYYNQHHHNCDTNSDITPPPLSPPQKQH